MLADYFMHQPTKYYQSIQSNFLDEDIMIIRDGEIPDLDEGSKSRSRWKLIFDGTSNTIEHGIGAVITSPTGYHIPFTVGLCFTCTNNMAEYEACIQGLTKPLT